MHVSSHKDVQSKGNPLDKAVSNLRAILKDLEATSENQEPPRHKVVRARNLLKELKRQRRDGEVPITAKVQSFLYGKKQTTPAMAN
jgi:hypothetical protein